MKPEIKAAWVAALRSGEYKQGKNVLHDPQDDSYCCLGVLCELAVKDGVVTRTDRESYSYYGVGLDDSMSILPNCVVQWAGMENSNPNLGTDDLGDPATASWHNDHLGADFNKIADLIEEHL